MKRKRALIIIGIAVVVFLLGAFSFHKVKENYRLGYDLYSGVCVMSTQTSELARELAFLDREFENAGDDEAVYRPGFDAAMADVRTFFGYDDIPLEEEVRLEWIHRFGELYDQTKSDEGLRHVFTDEEERKEMMALKDQLSDMTDHLVEFIDSFNQTSEWDRYFAPWKDEREILSDKVRLQ